MEFIGSLSENFFNIVGIFLEILNENFSCNVLKNFLKILRDFYEVILRRYCADFENFLEKLGKY